jgi:hypothetical protein
MNSASLYSLAGWSENPIPPRCLAHIAKRIEYKEATLRFGRQHILIFEVFLGLHRKREGEEGGTEPVLLNVYGALELIPRNEFRQPM